MIAASCVQNNGCVSRETTKQISIETEGESGLKETDLNLNGVEFDDKDLRNKDGKNIERFHENRKIPIAEKNCHMVSPLNSFCNEKIESTQQTVDNYEYVNSSTFFLVSNSFLYASEELVTNSERKLTVCSK